KLDEVKQIAGLQERIARKLSDLRYADGESEGRLFTIWPKSRCSAISSSRSLFRRFLALSLEHSSELADVTVDLQTDLEEMKDAIAEMAPHLLRLVNFLNS